MTISHAFAFYWHETLFLGFALDVLHIFVIKFAPSLAEPPICLSLEDHCFVLPELSFHITCSASEVSCVDDS